MNSGSGPGGLVKEFLRTQPLAGQDGAEANGILDAFVVQAANSTDNGQTGIVYVSNIKTATFRYTRLDLRSMLSNAYDISERNIEISPALPAQKFDFLVHVPKASEDSVKPLLRLALLSVYGAEVRWSKKEKPVMLLRWDESAAQPGLSPAASIGSCSCGRSRIRSTGVKMGTVARALEGIFGMPVVDETGLGGMYDITLEWTAGSKESLAAALRQQLGVLAVPASLVMDVLEAFAAVTPAEQTALNMEGAAQ